MKIEKRKRFQPGGPANAHLLLFCSEIIQLGHINNESFKIWEESWRMHDIQSIVIHLLVLDW